MKFQVITNTPESTTSDCLVVGITPDGLSAEAKRLDKVCKGAIRRAVNLGDIAGKAGESLYLYSLDGIKCSRVLLLGCGQTSKLDGKVWSKIIRSAFSALNKGGSHNAAFFLSSIKIYFKVLFKWSNHCCNNLSKIGFHLTITIYGSFKYVNLRHI